MEEKMEIMNVEGNRSFAKTASLCGWSLLMYFALSTFFQMIGLIIYSVITKCPFEEINVNAELIICLFCMIAALLLTFFVFFGRHFIPLLRGKWLFDSRTVKGVKMGLPMVLTGMYISSCICLAVSFVAGRFGIGYNTDILNIEYEGIGFVVNLIYSCLLAPLFEELVYRGFIMGALQPYGTKSAVIASALIFAVMHGVFAQMPLAFFAGLVLGSVAVYTKSLTAPVIIHIIYNSIAVCGNFIPADSVKGVVMYGSILFVLAVTGVVVFFAGYHKFRPMWEEDGAAGRVLRFMTKVGVILFTAINILVAVSFIEKV